MATISDGDNVERISFYLFAEIIGHAKVTVGILLLHRCLHLTDEHARDTSPQKSWRFYYFCFFLPRSTDRRQPTLGVFFHIFSPLSIVTIIIRQHYTTAPVIDPGSGLNRWIRNRLAGPGPTTR